MLNINIRIMKVIEIEELKKIQLEILLCVDKFCSDNHIDYFLDYGTLIGAIRHKGYIPWDDDIDISMTRNNYMKFLANFNGAYSHLEVIAPELDINYYAPYANVYDNRTILNEPIDHRGYNIGVKIDIFPIDLVPEDIMYYHKMRRRALFIWELMKIKIKPIPKNNLKSFVKTIIYKLISFPFTYSSLQQKIIDIACNGNNSLSRYADNMVFETVPDTRCERHIFEEYISVEFEGYRLKTIKEYDERLKRLYGEYMQLPPEDKQIPHHDFEAFWK